MKQKLTLTVDPEAVATAKRVAKKKGVSVSSMFEKWLLDLGNKDDRPKFGEEMLGLWKNENPPTDDERLNDILAKHCR